jgi:hypothetical protein
MSELSWVTQSQVPEFGLIKSATVTLTDAQIKANTVTPVVIIPATETLNYSGFPATVPKIISACVILDARAGAYTDISVNGGVLFLALGSDAGGPTISGSATIAGAASIAPVGITAQAEKQMLNFIVGDNVTLADDGTLDNGISIYMLNDTPLSGGNPANTMKVIVYYIVVDVS